MKKQQEHEIETNLRNDTFDDLFFMLNANNGGSLCETFTIFFFSPLLQLVWGKMRLSAKHPITMIDDIAVRVESQTDFSAHKNYILTDMLYCHRVVDSMRNV